MGDQKYDIIFRQQSRAGNSPRLAVSVIHSVFTTSFSFKYRSQMAANPSNDDKAQETKPWGDASRSLVSQIEVGSKDCLSCRIVGSATFAGVGIYALRQSRASAPGTLAQKRIIGGLGVGMSENMV